MALIAAINPDPPALEPARTDWPRDRERTPVSMPQPPLNGE